MLNISMSPVCLPVYISDAVGPGNIFSDIMSNVQVIVDLNLSEDGVYTHATTTYYNPQPYTAPTSLYSGYCLIPHLITMYHISQPYTAPTSLYCLIPHLITMYHISQPYTVPTSLCSLIHHLITMYHISQPYTVPTSLYSLIPHLITMYHISQPCTKYTHVHVAHSISLYPTSQLFTAYYNH